VASAGGTFGKELFTFLEELSDNNNRGWFEANKTRYEATVREPAREFIRRMGPRIKPIAPHLTADDRKVGGSLMRIYRDVRFSHDKTPYKTNLGIQFRHNAGKDVHAPGLYVHAEADDTFVGAGMWHPDGASLRRIRARIAEEPRRWRRIVGETEFKRRFTLAGDTLKTAPRDYAKDHPMIEDLKRKDFIAVAEIRRADVVSDAFEDTVIECLMIAAPFMGFLCDAIGEEL
jgi:uncharacterized protein (TIGR02453 family)